MEIIKNIHAFFWESMSANNCNTYLIEGSIRILIDPGHTELFEHVEKGLDQLHLGIEDIDVIICTHGHPDHIEAASKFDPLFSQLSMHVMEWQFLEKMAEALQATMSIPLDKYQPAFFLHEGNLDIADTHLEIIHTPGHSPGSICIYSPLDKVLITGDLIFKEGIGRTDLPGGDGALMKESLRGLIDRNRPVEYVLPGHGEIITGAYDIKKTLTQIEQFWFNYI
jgi:glyoxylase-like metal-dependent hydrolase (beta-lactamase superfamily II)